MIYRNLIPFYVFANNFDVRIYNKDELRTLRETKYHGLKPNKGDRRSQVDGIQCMNIQCTWRMVKMLHN